MTMERKAWAMAAGAWLAACASTGPNTAATAATVAAAERTTAERSVTSAEWEAMRERGDFAPAELEQVGEREEVSVTEARPPPLAGTTRLTECLPGGSSEAVVRERATGALWRLVAVGRVHAPAGVSISATRCFARVVRLPPGASLAGRLRVSYP
ncbi:MAG: hypothetical protein U0324_10445 [Polyangiales bacterium]